MSSWEFFGERVRFTYGKENRIVLEPAHHHLFVDLTASGSVWNGDAVRTLWKLKPYVSLVSMSELRESFDMLSSMNGKPNHLDDETVATASISLDSGDCFISIGFDEDHRDRVSRGLEMFCAWPKPRHYRLYLPSLMIRADGTDYPAPTLSDFFDGAPAVFDNFTLRLEADEVMPGALDRRHAVRWCFDREKEHYS